MGPAGLFCVRLSQFLMSGSRGHPDDQYRNEKRTRSVTRTVHRPLAHDLVLEVSYPRGPTRRRQGVPGARRRGAIELREWRLPRPGGTGVTEAWDAARLRGLLLTSRNVPLWAGLPDPGQPARYSR
jgi:hypothetical protein